MKFGGCLEVTVTTLATVRSSNYSVLQISQMFKVVVMHSTVLNFGVL